MKVSNRLKEARERIGHSREEAAKLSGLEPSDLLCFEQGLAELEK